MAYISIFVSLLFIFLVIILCIIKRHYSFWKQMGIPHFPATFPFGNTKQLGTKYHSSELFKIYYTAAKQQAAAPFVGLYVYVSKVALITDLDLVKQILQIDFDNFYDRQVYYNERDDPLSAHMFAIRGAAWKSLRLRLTPTFSSSKLKCMLPTMDHVTDSLVQSLSNAIEANPNGSIVDIKEFYACYTTDTIAACGYGIDSNALHEPPTNQFRQMGRNIFERPRHSLAIQWWLNNNIWFGNFLRIKLIQNDVVEFFTSIVRQTIAHRESDDSQHARRDFMSLLVEMKNSSDTTTRLSMDEVGAQALVFFVAGNETTSALLSFCTFELALHTDLQEKARQEARNVLTEFNGEFSYEAMLKMSYVDQCLNEALRKYPPLATLSRSVRNDYPIQGTTGLYIPRDSSVLIPIYAIHHDPDIYPDPLRFDPDRFDANAIRTRHPLAFLPFGAGPRNCIGLRFGMMVARMALAKILVNYRWTLDEQMPTSLAISSSSLPLASDRDIGLKFEKIVI